MLKSKGPKRLSRPWTCMSVVLYPGLLDWESGVFTTRLLLHIGKVE